MLAYLVSLLKSSTQTERDHQERRRVHSFQGVKADITAFCPISDSRGDSVSKKMFVLTRTNKHKKVTFEAF